MGEGKRRSNESDGFTESARSSFDLWAAVSRSGPTPEYLQGFAWERCALLTFEVLKFTSAQHRDSKTAPPRRTRGPQSPKHWDLTCCMRCVLAGMELPSELEFCPLRGTSLNLALVCVAAVSELPAYDLFALLTPSWLHHECRIRRSWSSRAVRLTLQARNLRGRSIYLALLTPVRLQSCP